MKEPIRTNDNVIIGYTEVVGRKTKVYDFENNYKGWTENGNTYSPTKGIVARAELPMLLLLNQ